MADRQKPERRLKDSCKYNCSRVVLEERCSGALLEHWPPPDLRASVISRPLSSCYQLASVLFLTAFSLPQDYQVSLPLN